YTSELSEQNKIEAQASGHSGIDDQAKATDNAFFTFLIVYCLKAHSMQKKQSSKFCRKETVIQPPTVQYQFIGPTGNSVRPKTSFSKIAIPVYNADTPHTIPIYPANILMA